MSRARRIWPLIAIATALLILFAAAHLAAQKRTTEPTNAFGQGTVINTDYNPDGTVYRQEWVDSKGRLREVKTYSYDPDTKSLAQKNVEFFREDGSLDLDIIYVYDQNGKLVKDWFRTYDPQGNQTSGSMYDGVNAKHYRWNPDKDTYEEFEILIESGVRFPLAKPEKKPEQPAPPAKKPGDISYEPVELGMLMPSNLKPGDTFSASVMPAADAKNYASVPGLTVRTFNVTLPSGQYASEGYQGLTIGTTDTGPAPLVDGHFTLTIPPAKVTVSLVNRQENDPRSKPTTTDFSLTTPSWVGYSNISRPSMTRAELDYWLRYLNYLWFKVNDYEEEWEDAYAGGAPKSVLWEIDDDIDSAQAAADRLARSLPIDEVRKLAFWKAIYEAWLDQRYHHGTSTMHKNNIDYYKYRAVPQDYFARPILYALAAPPILQVGRLGVLRGNFSGDCNDTRVNVDGLPVRFIASNLNDYYFMPPEQMTPGPHTLSVWNGPFRYAIPVFSMKLAMSIDTSMLHTQSYPKSTIWHLTLSGLNGMPASAWSGGSFSPDLVSLGDLGKIPEGFQPPDQTRQGVIVLKASNLSQSIISIPELPGGQKTWVLDAQKFAPSGEFHIDARADALRDGDFIIRGLAVAMLKPVVGTPERPGPPSGAPENLPPSTSSHVSDKTPAQVLDEAGDAWTKALSRTETKRVAMDKAWGNACNKVPAQLLSAYENAGKDFSAANMAWRNSVLEYDKNPTDENHKKIASLSVDRYQKKLPFDQARDAVINAMNPAARDTWRATHTDYEDAAYHEALAKETLEEAYKAAGPTK